jgi:hypothetical protein
MTESGAARPGDSQGRNLLQKHLGEILASQTSHPSIEKPCSIGGPSRRATHLFWREPLLSHQLAHEVDGRAPVSPALNQNVEDLAFVIDGAP